MIITSAFWCSFWYLSRFILMLPVQNNYPFSTQNNNNDGVLLPKTRVISKQQLSFCDAFSFSSSIFSDYDSHHILNIHYDDAIIATVCISWLLTHMNSRCWSSPDTQFWIPTVCQMDLWMQSLQQISSWRLSNLIKNCTEWVKQRYTSLGHRPLLIHPPIHRQLSQGREQRHFVCLLQCLSLVFNHTTDDDPCVPTSSWFTPPSHEEESFEADDIRSARYIEYTYYVCTRIWRLRMMRMLLVVASAPVHHIMSGLDLPLTEGSQEQLLIHLLFYTYGMVMMFALLFMM